MLTLRSLQRRTNGVELWAIIPRQADADRTYLVRGPGSRLAEVQFGRLTNAEAEFDRRLRAAARRYRRDG